MRSKRQLCLVQSQLLHHFSQMPVSEHRVSGEIVRHGNEMRTGCRRFTGSRNARLRVRNNSTLAIDQAGLQQRCQRQNDRGCVAARVRHQLSRAQCGRRSALRQANRTLPSAVNSAAVAAFASLKPIDRTMPQRLRESPCATQIDDPQTLSNRLRRQVAGRFMRRRQKKQLHTLALQFRP